MAVRDTSADPCQRQAALDASGHCNDVMTSSSMLESLIESRFASLERLVAMQTMFYHMAAHVANFW